MIIHPWYLKCDDSFRLCYAFQYTVFHIFWMFFKNRNKLTEYFFDSLEEFLLMWISLFYHCNNFIHIFTYPLFIRYFFKIYYVHQCILLLYLISEIIIVLI